MLDAAEALFLERDPAEVSVRMVNAAAGLNPGAVHYHFGSKEGLVLALLEDRLKAHFRVSLQMESLAAQRELRISDVVALAVDPMLELSHGGPRERVWVRLLAETIRRDPRSAFARATFDPEPWVTLAVRALPRIPPDAVRRRWGYAVSLLLSLVEDPDTDRDELIAFIAGGLAR